MPAQPEVLRVQASHHSHCIVCHAATDENSYSLSERITDQTREARQEDTGRTSQGLSNPTAHACAVGTRLCRDIQGRAFDWFRPAGLSPAERSASAGHSWFL